MSPWLSGRLLRSQTDERLAALVSAGHDRAFAVLVERYRRPLLAFVRGLGAGARGEDVVQQALMQAWVSLHAGTEVAHVRGWLHQIARRAAWRAAAGPATEELSQTLASAFDTEGEVERRLETRWLLTQLERLPERQRDALVQTALQGRSGDEVAGGLGLTDNGLRQLLFRARSTLRAAASALVPLQVVAWAADRGASTAPMNERVAELVGSSGSVGVAAGLAKTAAVVATAGSVAGGVAAHHDAGNAVRRDAARPSHASRAASPAHTSPRVPAGPDSRARAGAVVVTTLATAGERRVSVSAVEGGGRTTGGAVAADRGGSDPADRTAPPTVPRSRRRSTERRETKRSDGSKDDGRYAATPGEREDDSRHAATPREREGDGRDERHRADEPPHASDDAAPPTAQASLQSSPVEHATSDGHEAADPQLPDHPDASSGPTAPDGTAGDAD
jgi:RNA polymerase sigma factor (sigma-70 family)